MALERLQKLLARAGLGSRRACEEIITAGRVTVDGRAVAELGAKADLETQDVRVDGERIRPERPEYWLLNKPKGVVCTNFDPAGRQRPIDLMGQTKARLFPVGRLDADSKGLLLMTNDGAFANRLAHPRYEVPKTYVASVAGELTRDAVYRLVRGVWFAEGRTHRAEVRLLKRGRSRSIVEVTIRESRNRQIRRMLAKLGHNVRELVRTRIGKIGLRGLRVGQSRRLTPEEVDYLRTLPDQPPPVRPRPTPKPQGRARLERGRAAPRDRGAPPPVRPRPTPKPQGRASLERGRAAPRDRGAPPPAAGGRPGPQMRRQPRPVREREWRREPGPEDREAAPEAPHPFMENRREGRGEPRPAHRRQAPASRPHPFSKERREGRGEHPLRRDERREHSGPPFKAGDRREKRSPMKHDTDGAGKAGEGHGRHEGRGGGGRRFGRGGPPGRGRRPHRHPPQ